MVPERRFSCGSTALWFLFEIAGYNLLSFISNVLLLLVAILFFWGKSASLLNRPLPPLPSLEVSEETALRAADEIRVWVNYALAIAHDIAIGGSFLDSFLSLCSFFTLVYIDVLLSFSLPVLYDKYQKPIDDKLSAAYNIAQVQYRKIDDKILRKLPLPSKKEKKTR
ncbi:UNVERIFIED_CONTAM: Reticulon-like protein B11 [Sesamum latifolium]|uniref:Reticulon-like protein n=1 Tax=Sesamum latifolium TaxID=2727402 RepID=A0AAW2XL25_9LAMI